MTFSIQNINLGCFSLTVHLNVRTFITALLCRNLLVCRAVNILGVMKGSAVVSLFDIRIQDTALREHLRFFYP